MFSTKKDVDRHVKSSISKLPEKEKNLRGYTIAKLYFKIGEYTSAQQWLSLYLAVNEENSQAHKLLGQCYEKRKIPDKAIASYQRSYQLDSKQKGLIVDICKLFLTDDTLLSNPVRAKYWCDLADTERLQDENVLSLKLKLNKDSRVVEDLLVKETIARPTDVGLRIRLVKYFLEEQKFAMAFKYCNDVSMKFNNVFMQSLDWHNTVAQVLTTYREKGERSVSNQWDFWLLYVLTLENQVALSLASENGVLSNKESNLKETARLLFEFDQLLQKASEVVIVICSEKELAGVFLQHYRGQLCLHIAAYLFKLEQVYNKNQWRETTRKCLPLLLLAHQCATPNHQENWLRNSSEATRQLVYYWRRQASFRCAQAGKCLFSSVDSASAEQDVIQQIRQVTDNKNWKTAEDVSAQIRQFCMDSNWRNHIYRSVFTKTEQLSQSGSSYFARTSTLAEPTSYELPNAASLLAFDDAAQNWNPSSLQHLVYLGMDCERHMVDVQCDIFKNLNFSVNNLANCNADTINRLDLESFLICAVIVANRVQEVERNNYESYSERPNDRPSMLPAANLMSDLCTDDQIEWWKAAHKFIKNTSLGDKATEVKSLLQYGIEAVRGVGAIKIDLILLFKLAKILSDRALQALKPDEKRALEVRSEELNKHALHFFKLHQSGDLDAGLRSLFKFSTTNFDVHRELHSLAEDAVIYLAKRYFANQKYDECIQELQDLQLPFATYFLSEAYKKLDDLKKTPRKERQLYAVKVRDYFEETVQLLNEPLVDKNHPLRSILSTRSRRAVHDALNTSTSNGFSNGDDQTDEFLDSSATSFRNRMQNTREQSFTSAAASKTLELENLIRKMMETLNIVKEDVVSIRHDVTEIQEKLQKLEEGQKKATQHQSDVINDVARGGSGDDDFSDMYLLDDLQSQAYLGQPAQSYSQQQAMANKFSAMMMPQASNPYNQLYNTAYPMYMQQYLNSPAAVAYRQNQQTQQQYGEQLLMTTAAVAAQQNQQYSGVLPQQTASQLKYPLIEQGLSHPTLLNTWNSTYNNPQQQHQPQPQATYQPPPQQQPQQQPVVTPAAPPARVAPVNVVITQSDPLPPSSTITQANQPTLTVTIPPHLIKHTPTTHLATLLTSTNTTTTTAFAAQPSQPKVTQLFENISPAGETNDNELLNTSTEYDPRPDFQPIIPLPDEIEVRTGEENENVLFTSRAKLFRFDTTTKEWKEKGIGDMKILKNKDNDKIRVLMRREQVHKICANHNITPQLELKEDKQPTTLTWVANDFSEGELKTEMLCIRFKLAETAQEFKRVFNEAKKAAAKLEEEDATDTSDDVTVNFTFSTPKSKSVTESPAVVEMPKATFGGFTGKFGTGLLPAPTTIAPTTPSTTPKFSFAANVTPKTSSTGATDKKEETQKASPFANFTFGKTIPAATTEPAKLFGDMFNNLKLPTTITTPVVVEAKVPVASPLKQQPVLNTSGHNDDDEYVPTAQFQPVIPLPDLIDVKTGEENENCVFEHRAKLLRFDTTLKEWKERGVGNMKIMVDKMDANKARLLMRRDQVHKLCCNQRLYKDTKFTKLPKSEVALSWGGPDYSENEMKFETLAIRFKISDVCETFHAAVKEAQKKMSDSNTQDGATKADEEKKVVSEKKEEVKGFGDQFKPKAGAWTCDGCYTANVAENVTCLACEAPKPGTMAPPKPAPATTSQFSFGVAGGGFSFASKPIEEPPKVSTDDASKGFGEQFKPKAGSWNCPDCYTSNTADNLHCLACEAPKDATVPKKESSGFGSATSKFSFGVNPTETTTPSSSTFSFGTATPASGGFSFGSAKSTTSTTLFATPKATPEGGFSFGSFAKSTPESPKTTTTAAETAGSLPLEKNKFEFVLKPKSPSKVKSPVKSPGATPNDDHTDNEYHEEEENNTYFTPVIPLPDKIEVVTGEENEETLYCHRAKLFHFIDGEWKERGIGDVKIQKRRENGKLRVLMRREKIHKICLNHPLTHEVVYKPKDEKSWMFGASDFSEGFFETKQFTLRFKTVEVATEFKMAIETALIDNDGSTLNGHSHTEKDATTTPATVAISAEERALALKLKLPESFYETANNSPACRGCRGCKSDDYVFGNGDKNVNADIVDTTPLPLVSSQIKVQPKVKITPQGAMKPLPIRNLFGVKNTENEQSPINVQNIFGSTAAANADKENNKPADVKSTFSFLGSAAATVEPSRPTSIFSSQLNTTATPSLIPNTIQQKPIFGGGVASNQTLFAKPSLTVASTATATATATITPPKEGASLFSGSSFNATKTTSIFGGTGFGGGTSPAQPAQSIFGSSTFGSGSDASSFSFATAALNLEKKAASEASTKLLNTDGAATAPTDTSTSIFKTDSSLGFGSLAAATATKTNDLSRDQPSKSPDFLNVDNSLSFASLAAKTGDGGFLAGGTENSEFKGFKGLTIKEDIFSKLANKSVNAADTSASGSGTGNGDQSTDENYDPHYEPIIKLPDEIVIKTGEEDEEKLHGERAKLYRFDPDTKEWKERGVGELKILYHPINGTYRLLLRREQIHKLVLNHAITEDFTINLMNTSRQAYCWGAMNHAEEPAIVEKLAARFKNEALAELFRKEVEKCVESLRKRAGLEPEED